MKFSNIYACTFLLAASQAGASELVWPDNSVLAGGKWVEVTVEGSGIRKIPFSMLREMGFESPEQVSVYGRAGENLPLPFFDESKNPLQPADLSKLNSACIGDALYFYCPGLDNYTFEPDAESPLGGRFVHAGKNLYASSSTFLLSESPDKDDMPTSAHDWTLDHQQTVRPVALVFHEADLQQNNHNNGQIFWGETFPEDGSCLEWEYSVPGSKGCHAVMQWESYIESESAYEPKGTCHYGIRSILASTEEGEARISVSPVKNKTSYHAPQPCTPFSFIMPADAGYVFASYDRDGSDCYVANLDWWSVSVGFDPEARLAAGEKAMTFAVPAGGLQTAVIPISAGMHAWDITDPCRPESLQTGDGGTRAGLDFKGCGFRMVTLFNPDADLPGVDGWRAVENQNLHQLASQGADFAIVCTPELIEEAEKIADIHRVAYGQKCIVATTEQVYREFSGAIPDPMGYRNFVKMIYDSPVRVKNLLLLGNVTADVRGVQASAPRGNRIISYQKSLSSKHDGAMSDVDIYGVMDERITPKSSLESMTVAVGVGVLPADSKYEAELYVEKLERYVSGEGFENHIADHLLVGCDGDNHVHEKQCEFIRSQLDSYSDGYRQIPVYNDELGAKPATEKMISTFNSGVGLATYIGHGGCLILTKDKDFFGYQDIKYLRSKTSPFMIFAACDITNGDTGQRGISEQMVVGTRFGLIGAITSNRTAMSSSNYELVKTFYEQMRPEATGHQRTIGEVYASTKSIVKSINELSFFLLADPAIIVPVPTCGFSDPGCRLEIGKMNSFSGYVTDADGDVAKDFTGKVSARIVVPAESSCIRGVVTGSEGPEVKGEDSVVAVGNGVVDSGRYEISLAPSVECADFTGREMKIVLSAYDTESKTAAASSFVCAVEARAAGDEEKDSRGPVVEEFAFDDDACSLLITLTDDTAIDFASNGLAQGVALAIDGKPQSASALADVKFLPDASRARISVVLPSIERGIHNARIRVRDVAGNVTSRDLSFVVGSHEYSIRLSAYARHEKSEIVYAIDSEIPYSGMKLHLTDAAGREVRAVDVDSTSVSVSTEGIPSGVTHAYCEDTATGIRSQTITIPIIKLQSSR